MVRTDGLPGCVDHASWLHRCWGQTRAYEGAVITVRNKTDLLAFGLLGHLEPQPYGDLTHLLLAIFTERQERVPQLRLGQIKEEVGLIFLRIASPSNVVPPTLVLPHGCVMSRRHPTRPQLLRPLQQGRKFEIAVALHAGVRRGALAISIDKVVDDMLGKLRLEIDHVEGNTEGRCHAARIGYVLQRTTSFVVGCSRLWPVPELHGDTNHLIALLVQQRRADRAIHTATHGDHHTLSHVILPPGPRRLPVPHCRLAPGVLGRLHRMIAVYSRSVGSSTEDVQAPFGVSHGAPYVAR